MKQFKSCFAVGTIVGSNTLAIIGRGVGFMTINHIADNVGVQLCGAKYYRLFVGVDLRKHLYYTVFVALTDFYASVVKVAFGVCFFGVDFALNVVVGIVGVLVDVAFRRGMA